MTKVLPKDNEHSPYHIGVPNSDPTVILAQRCEAFRQILKALVAYLKEVSVAQDHFSQINSALKGSLSVGPLADLTSENIMIDGNKVLFGEFGNHGLQDIQVILKKHHTMLANQQFRMSRELASITIPKLEALRKDLKTKIKEIKDLQGDFSINDTKEQLAFTGQCLDKYMAAIEYTESGKNSELLKVSNDQLKPKSDPYLLKLRLDLQLKKQLVEENYLKESYIGIETTAMQLESYVVHEIQDALKHYSSLLDAQVTTFYDNMLSQIKPFMNSKPWDEWDRFVVTNNTLLNLTHKDPDPQPRKLSQISYPYQTSPHAKLFQSGYMMKKNKVLKTYSKSYYILTTHFLHEYKNSKFYNDEDPPISSIPLNQALLTESSDTKIVLKTSKGSVIFKPLENIEKWVSNLKKLTAFDDDASRAEFVTGKPSLEKALSSVNLSDSAFITGAQTTSKSDWNYANSVKSIPSSLDSVLVPPQIEITHISKK